MRKWMTYILALVALLAFTPLVTAWPASTQSYHGFDRPGRWIDTRTYQCNIIWPPGSPCAVGPHHDLEYRNYQLQSVYISIPYPPGSIEVPLGAMTAVLSVTVSDATGKGWISFYKGEPQYEGTQYPPMPHPVITSVSFMAGESETSLVFVNLGDIQFQTPGSDFYPDILTYTRVAGGGTVNVIVDVVGYAQ